jgi:hypothetical protein
VVIAVTHSGKQRPPLTAKSSPEVDSWFSVTGSFAVTSQQYRNTGGHSFSNFPVAGIDEMDTVLGRNFFHFHNPLTDISCQ